MKSIYLLAVLPLALCACGGEGSPYVFTPTVMAGQSFTMPAGGIVMVPAEATVVDSNGNLLVIKGENNEVRVFPGAIVSVPSGTKGEPTNTVKAI